jgi:hypothetical protein
MKSDAAGALKEGIEHLEETAADYVKEGRARARSMEISAKRAIRGRPIAAMLVAIGLGFLAGRLSSRR